MVRGQKTTKKMFIMDDLGKNLIQNGNTNCGTRSKHLDIKDFNIYSKKINPGYRSDILRYIILNKYGGLCRYRF